MSHHHDIFRWLYEAVEDDWYVVTVGAIENRSSCSLDIDIIDRYDR